MPSSRQDVATSPRRGEGWATITSVAKEAFDELGYHGVSIRDIAQRAGMSLSALYYYYNSKHDLLVGILELGLDDYHRILEARSAAAADDPVAQFDALVSGLIEYRATHQVESRLMMSEMKHLDEPAQLQLKQVQRVATKKLTEAIDQARAAGRFTTEYPEEARRAVWATCNAIATWYSPTGPQSLEEIIQRNLHLAHVLVGYREDAPGHDKAVHTEGPSKPSRKRAAGRATPGAAGA